MFCKKGVLRNFEKFTGKHLCQKLFLIKLTESCSFIKKESLAHVFSCEFCEISKNIFFYRTHPVAASVLSNIYDGAVFPKHLTVCSRLLFPQKSPLSEMVIHTPVKKSSLIEELRLL